MESRRPLKTRQARWAQGLAAAIGRTPIQPNWISCGSIAFAGASAACLVESAQRTGTMRVGLLLAAAGGIQLRLLCNLLDGMVAVEGGKKSKTGDVFNELPDRIADLLILVGAGYGAGLPWLGWLAGTLAVLTAYVRALGASLGTAQDFSGVQSKPKRMAVITVACILSCFEPLFTTRGEVLVIALAVVALGSAVTVSTRTRKLMRELNSR